MSTNGSESGKVLEPVGAAIGNTSTPVGGTRVGYRQLDGSHRLPVAGARRIGAVAPDEELSVSVRVRRRGNAQLPSPGPSAPAGRLSRDEFAVTYGADPADIDLVEDFAHQHGLTVRETSIARRTVVLEGTAARLGDAFAVDLGRYQVGETTYRGREGHVHIPDALAPVVEGVFGLDDRQQARPAFRAATRTTAAGLSGTSTPDIAVVQTPVPAADGLPAQNGTPAENVTALTPPQVATLYDFPTGLSAAGQCIGLLEFGGGYHPADINAWYDDLNLTPPTLVDIGVDGAGNSPGSDADTEVVLDIDVAGSAAPGARIAVYFAPWTEQGWVDVVTTAVHDAVNDPSVLSISWGWPESATIDGLTWTPAAMAAVGATFAEAALLGTTVLAASGDQGSDCQLGDGRAHVLYPTSDPYVTSCGGTEIENVVGRHTFTEVLWNDNGASGGGVSANFALPYWQNSAGVPASVNDGHHGRGVPDIAGNADPNSGYTLIQNGSRIGPIGGTSATAPLYAGLVALLNAHLNHRVGYLNPTLYQLTASDIYRDVTAAGTNAVDGAPGYPVARGWDATTGLGSINGVMLLDALKGRLVPTVAWGPDRLDAFVLGTDLELFHKYWDGAEWGPATGYEPLGGICIGSPSVVSWGPDRLDAFVVGTDRALFHKYFDGSAWGPAGGYDRLGGVCLHSPAAVSWGAGRLDVFVIGTDGALYHKWFDGTSWGPSVDGYEWLGGVCIGTPTVVSSGPGLLDVFVIGTDGALYHKWFDGTSWGPSPDGYERLGGICVGNPTAVSWGPGRLDVFVIGTDGALYHKWNDGTSWGPSLDGYEWLGGVCVGNPTAVSWGPDRLDVFVIGTDGALFHKAWDGASWYPSPDGYERLGGVCVGEAAAVSWGADRLDVFVVGTDLAVFHKAWDGAAWQPSADGYERLGGIVE